MLLTFIFKVKRFELCYFSPNFKNVDYILYDIGLTINCDIHEHVDKGMYVLKFRLILYVLVL